MMPCWKLAEMIEKHHIANNMKVRMLEYKFKLMNILRHRTKLVIS